MISIDISFPAGMLLDYLAYLFPPDEVTGHYKVTMASDIGRLIVAYTETGEYPPSSVAAEGERMITLDLPDCDQTQNFRNKFIRISPFNRLRLIGALKTFIHMDLINYYQWATLMGYRKKEAIEMFCVSRKLANVDPYEALHKRVYRLEQRKMSKTVKMLYNKVRYFEQSLDKEGVI